MKKMRILFFLLLLCFTSAVIAQNKQITGKVINKETGAPLEGLSVMADKTTQGVVTKADGTYSISVKAGTNSLVFSFVGFETKIVSIGTKKNIDVDMTVAVAEGSEVVVVGYGTQKKSSLTGAIAKFKNEKLDEAPVARLDQALQGKIAGVQIQNVSSEAGAAPKISIRGISSLNAGSSPLIVIDGMPVPDGLSFLNPADVESIEVLKDAASAAIYGSRGASGVIMVTTKKGSVSKTKYNFKFTSGQKKDYKRYDVMTTKDYVGMLFAEMKARSVDPNVVQSTNTVIDADRASYIIETQLLRGQSTDWQSESLRPGSFKNIQLNASGGSKDVRYFVSGGYQNDEGMMNKSNYEKFNIRTKVDVDFSKKVKLSLNVNPSYAKRISPSQNFTNFWRMPRWLPVYHNDLTSALVRSNPQYSSILQGDFSHPRHYSGLKYTGLMPDGSTWTSPTTSNPSGSAQQNPLSDVLRSDISSNEYRLQSSAELSIQLAKGLLFKTLATSMVNFTNGLNFFEREYNSEGSNNSGLFINNNYTDLLSENTFNYTKSVKKHDFALLAGFTSQTTKVKNQQTAGIDFPSDDIRTLNSAAQIDAARTTGTNNQIGLLSYLGRLNYAYDDKYLVSVSFRTDGSSYFGNGKKWGSFPSISGGWVLSKEKFMSNMDWISNLKLRASYGTTGNENVDPQFVGIVNGGPSYGPTANSNGYNFNNVFYAGSTVGSAANDALRWEKQLQMNAGLDISLFKNALNISADYFQKEVDGLLFTPSASLYLGTVPIPTSNIGSTRSTGIDVTVTYNQTIAKKVKLNNAFTFTTAKNDIHKILIHHLYEYRKKHMKELIQKYEKLVKDGLTAKRNNVIYRALERGSVETLIVSANYHTNSQFKNILKMLEIAKKTSCKIEFATSPQIIKKLELDDSVLAILRYRIK